MSITKWCFSVSVCPYLRPGKFSRLALPLSDDPNERTRLFPTDQDPEPHRRRSNLGLSTFLWTAIAYTITLFAIAAAFNLMFRLARRIDPLDPLVRDRIRQEWASEVRQHDMIREQWTREIENHNQVERERRQCGADERLRLGMFWADLVGDRSCAAYATRE
ncbi:hypothetical protein BJ138DRAFT_405846 [Hygrophoropsis aurantiaca]|uniref:Uncharacterized protein n=1 Tax=Hygrophoropsis aurantiaca TaxID=72124 RepID=A0ACB8A4R1_9AGAM|nr:hypothetical protein BJ138DRAFT_405846 [Hygrophoropsis aurantiaca]